MTMAKNLCHGKGAPQSRGGEKSVLGHLCFPLIFGRAKPAMRVKGKRLQSELEAE